MIEEVIIHTTLVTVCNLSIADIKRYLEKATLAAAKLGEIINSLKDTSIVNLRADLGNTSQSTSLSLLEREHFVERLQANGAYR